MKKTKLNRTVGMLAVITIMISLAFSISSYAMSNKANGTVYEFDSKTNYELDKAVGEKEITEKTQTYGTMYISGELSDLGNANGLNTYCVENGNLSFTYKYDDKLLVASEDTWHLIDDGAKKINGIELDSKIGKGTIVVQTSKDGNKWVSVLENTDIFSTTPINDDPFYETTDIQLLNGCYYRIIVAYELKTKTDPTKIAFVSIDKYETKRIAEVYEFYAYNKDAELTNDKSDTKYYLGDTVNTGKDGNGYSEKNEIGYEDPHYNWQLGRFFVSGMTRTVDNDDEIVFLKNVGDKVTLGFELFQDIDCLNDSKALSISSDNDGYDQYFGTKKLDFGRGALIVRHTDYQNSSGEPQLYTNYLEALASPDADTTIRLCEEGDYEVALDYEVQNEKMVVFGKSILPGKSHYRIFIRFKVRNGNCMVYPFDVETGAELVNTSLTEHGFYLDLAKSRYLDINVRKEYMQNGTNGLVEDTRYNRPARDGEKFIDEGIYTITVKNRYTDESTIKKIYVGNNSILKAYVVTGLSIQDIQKKIDEGATILSDGTILMPENLSNNQIQPTVGETKEQNQEITITKQEDTKSNIPITTIVIILLALIIVVMFFVIKSKKKAITKEELKESNDDNQEDSI